MISKAVELALQAGFDADELRTLRDETLVWLLLHRFDDHPCDPASAELHREKGTV